MSTLNAATLREMMDRVRSIEQRARSANPSGWTGQIVFSPSCLRDSPVRLFPESVHRSARIRKKLIKRFGGEFLRVPAMFVVNGVLYAHPSHRAELLRRLDAPSLPGGGP
jgi:hypothetical protein